MSPASSVRESKCPLARSQRYEASRPALLVRCSVKNVVGSKVTDMAGPPRHESETTVIEPELS